MHLAAPKTRRPPSCARPHFYPTLTPSAVTCQAAASPGRRIYGAGNVEPHAVGRASVVHPKLTRVNCGQPLIAPHGACDAARVARARATPRACAGAYGALAVWDRCR